MTRVPSKITYRSLHECVCVLLHCLTSHQSKEKWKNKKATVFFFTLFKVKSIQHGHDATAGNEQITKLLHLYLSETVFPIVVIRTFSLFSVCTERRITDENREFIFKWAKPNYPLIQLLNRQQVGGSAPHTQGDKVLS